jgi:RNA polymerase-binding transcription factor DksA
MSDDSIPVPASHSEIDTEIDTEIAEGRAEAEATTLDLDRIERDLAGVELALARLDSGEYWTDEVTGMSIPDEHLAEHPTARRAPDQ